jgi:hypothetical protein
MLRSYEYAQVKSSVKSEEHHERVAETPAALETKKQKCINHFQPFPRDSSIWLSSRAKVFNCIQEFAMSAVDGMRRTW